MTPQADMPPNSMIRNSMAVASAGSGALYVLTTVYPESDPLNAGGQLLHHMLPDEGLTRSVLSVTSPLAAMWRSPAGHLWIGSADGTAWTTAAPRWQQDGPAFEAVAGGPIWTSTRLPRHQGTGGTPNITAVWGTSDTDVFFATVAGAVYRWNGSSWIESSTGANASLTKMDGGAADDAYAVGYLGTVAHWDGSRWTLLAVPELAAESTIVTGIAVLADGSVFAATNRGELLKRQGSRFAVEQKAGRVRFTGLAAWRDGLALSSATGAWFHDAAGLRQAKDNFAATDVYAVGDRLYFIETEQPNGPACVEYFAARRSGSAWQRVVF